VGSSPAIDLLREKIRRIEATDRRLRGVLPFGLPKMDMRLPGGGLEERGVGRPAPSRRGPVDQRCGRRGDGADEGVAA
jgi:protein ImuA